MNKTLFGFKEVEPAEKNRLVQNVFTMVAPGYDFMNDLMSLGLHHCWKHTFVNSLPLFSSIKVLDVAGGTADIALKVWTRLQDLRLGVVDLSSYSITVLDRNKEMLERGRNKAIDKGVIDLEWVCGDAEKLPFASSLFDLYTISFGIRNVTHRDQALREAHRVLKPGGIFACLEFSHSPHKKIDTFFKKVQFCFVPLLGHILRQDKDSYQYLVESIARFPEAEVFAQEIEQAGFKVASIQRLVKGGVAIHLAVRK